jgi:hypothetical protein
MQNENALFLGIEVVGVNCSLVGREHLAKSCSSRKHHALLDGKYYVSYLVELRDYLTKTRFTGPTKNELAMCKDLGSVHLNT